MIGWIIFLAICGGLIAWLRFSIWRVKPNERGIRVIGGVPSDVRTGFCFVPKFPGCYLIRIPMQLFKISLPSVVVYSREAPDCAREQILVSLSFFVRFPQGAGLIQAFQAGIPTNEEGLSNYFNSPVVEAVRGAVSMFTWREILGDVNQTVGTIQSFLILVGSIVEDFLNLGGIFQLVIEEITGSDSLKSLLAYRNQVQMTTQVTSEIAERKAILFTETILRKWGQATGKSIQEVQTEIRQTPALAKQFGDLIFQMASKEGIADGQFWNGSSLTSFHVNGPERSLVGLTNAFKVSTGQGNQKGRRTRRAVIGGEEIEVEDR